MGMIMAVSLRLVYLIFDRLLVSRAGSRFTVRFGDDRVGVFGPDERVAAVVPAVDECGDRLDEVVDGVEGAAADGLAGDDPEEDLGG